MLIVKYQVLYNPHLGLRRLCPLLFGRRACVKKKGRASYFGLLSGGTTFTFE